MGGAGIRQIEKSYFDFIYRQPKVSNSYFPNTPGKETVTLSDLLLNGKNPKCLKAGYGGTKGLFCLVRAQPLGPENECQLRLCNSLSLSVSLSALVSCELSSYPSIYLNLEISQSIKQSTEVSDRPEISIGMTAPPQHAEIPIPN